MLQNEFNNNNKKKKGSLIQIRDMCRHKSQKSLCMFSMMIDFENCWGLGDFELLSSDDSD